MHLSYWSTGWSVRKIYNPRRVIIMSNARNLPQVAALFGLTLMNVLLMAGLFPNGIPALQTAQIIVLAVIEIGVILLIRRHIKQSVNESFQS